MGRTSPSESEPLDVGTENRGPVGALCGATGGIGIDEMDPMGEVRRYTVLNAMQRAATALSIPFST